MWCAAMTAKQYLRQYLLIKSRVQSKHRQIARLKAQAYGTGGGFGERVQGGNPQDKMALIVDKYVAMESDLLTAIEELQATQSAVQGVIDSLHDERHKNVLELRYIEGLDFEDIADKLNYSYSYVLHMHGYALQAVGVIEHDRT